MESEEEALKYYLNEVKDTNTELEVEDGQILNEAEEATDFLHKVGLSDLTKLYSQGKAITENIVNDSVRQKNLTKRQAHTVKSRIRTLNKTLQNRQPRRKQRQDIRDVAWNIETSSTGTRSRSATPDSLDSVEILGSDEEHLPSVRTNFGGDWTQPVDKTKVKWTSSEPAPGRKITRDKADVAHLGSENVVLKGYQPLTEFGSLPRPQRERSGSDPTTDVHIKPLTTHNSDAFSFAPLSKPPNNCSKVYLNGDDSNDKEIVSFESLIQQNKFRDLSQKVELDQEEGVDIDEFTDGEYQHLKPLLYVELVTIFDQYKITFLKRKPSTKNKGGNVFGVNLATLVMRDMPRPTDNSMVPEIFQSVIRQLNVRCICEDGILRIAGQKLKLEFLYGEIETKFFNNRNEVEQLLWHATVHELTGVLKKLLRDLPDPVFTMELFDMFYKTSLIPNSDDRVKALNLLVLMLPIEHRNTYKLLLQFCLNIVEHEAQNRMNLHNVAMITAPSFFPPRLLLPHKENNKVNIMKQLTKEELAKQINGAAVCCCTMETMLNAGLNLWVVPSYLAHQAKEAQKKAQDRKDNNGGKERRLRIGKTKLVRSSTQYEPGLNGPRVRRDLII